MTSKPQLVPLQPPPRRRAGATPERMLIAVIRKVQRAYRGGALSMRVRAELDEELLIAARRYLLEKRVQGMHREER